jgi:hypothetical protein
MSAVYKRAVKKLGLQGADSCERDRLAIYILSISNSVKDANQMLDRAVRMYQRDAPYLGYRLGLGDALATQFRSCLTSDAGFPRRISNDS